MMTDDARMDQGDEERLPWLEAVDEDEDRDGPSIAKLVGAILIGLVAIAIIVGGMFWLGNRNRADGDGEIIAAPEGDYKVRPDQPGGMNATGEGATAQQASQGAEPKGRLDTGAAPEAPVARPSQPPPAQPGAPPAAPGATIQLGAFSSQAGATGAWRALSGRFRYLSPLSHSVVPVQSGGRTLYRLRASGAGAAEICRRLQVAGEDCAVID